MRHTLKCDTCGEEVSVCVHRLPNHRLEEATIAKANGWTTIHNEDQRKISIFCNVECEYLSRRA